MVSWYLENVLHTENWIMVMKHKTVKSLFLGCLVSLSFFSLSVGMMQGPDEALDPAQLDTLIDLLMPGASAEEREKLKAEVEEQDRRLNDLRNTDPAAYEQEMKKIAQEAEPFFDELIKEFEKDPEFMAMLQEEMNNAPQQPAPLPVAPAPKPIPSPSSADTQKAKSEREKIKALLKQLDQDISQVFLKLGSLLRVSNDNVIEFRWQESAPELEDLQIMAKIIANKDVLADALATDEFKVLRSDLEKFSHKIHSLVGTIATHEEGMSRVNQASKQASKVAVAELVEASYEVLVKSKMVWSSKKVLQKYAPEELKKFDQMKKDAREAQVRGGIDTGNRLPPADRARAPRKSGYQGGYDGAHGDYPYGGDIGRGSSGSGDFAKGKGSEKAASAKPSPKAQSKEESDKDKDKKSDGIARRSPDRKRADSSPDLDAKLKVSLAKAEEKIAALDDIKLFNESKHIENAVTTVAAAQDAADAQRRARNSLPLINDIQSKVDQTVTELESLVQQANAAFVKKSGEKDQDLRSRQEAIAKEIAKIFESLKDSAVARRELKRAIESTRAHDNQLVKDTLGARLNDLDKQLERLKSFGSVNMDPELDKQVRAKIKDSLEGKIEQKFRDYEVQIERALDPEQNALSNEARALRNFKNLSPNNTDRLHTFMNELPHQSYNDTLNAKEDASKQSVASEMANRLFEALEHAKKLEKHIDESIKKAHRLPNT